ncbi:hypothetical protein ACO1O0_007605 [Amphichorda felina]
MRFTVVLAPLLAAAATQAAVLQICHQALFKGCTSVTAPNGQCVKIPSDYDNKIFSARITTGNYCTTYEDYACNTLLIPKIDKYGVPTLPSGARTSSVICYD